MKIKKTCVKKKQLLQTEGKQRWKISKICFRQIKAVRYHQCLQSWNHCSRQWLLQFPCLLEDFFRLFVSSLIVTTAYQSPFSLWPIAVWFVIYYIYIAIVLSVLCILTLFSTFPVLISSNNSLGKFSSVKFTFCVFSFGANTFFWNFEFSNTTRYQIVITQDQIKMKTIKKKFFKSQSLVYVCFFMSVQRANQFPVQ